MRIYFRLESVHCTNEQNMESFHNPIPFEWDLPVLPRPRDIIYAEAMLDDDLIPEHYIGLAWHVNNIVWQMIDKQIAPVLVLIGE